MTPAEMDRLDGDALRLLGAHERGEHSALLAEVDKMAKERPLSAPVLGLAAASLLAMELGEDARIAAEKALKEEPGLAWLHLLRSRAAAGQGDWEKATAAAGAAVQLLPGEPLYLTNLAACLRQSGRHDTAIRTAREALAVSPDHVEALNQLGLALEAAGDLEGALAAFRRAQSVAPDSAEVCLHEGLLLRRAGRWSEANEAFREALRRQPGHSEAEDRLAEGLIRIPGAGAAAVHMLSLSRFTVAGWTIIAFLYYLFFRLLEFTWQYIPAMLPVSRVLLPGTLVWLLGGAVIGRLLRLSFRIRSA